MSTSLLSLTTTFWRLRSEKNCLWQLKTLYWYSTRPTTSSVHVRKSWVSSFLVINWSNATESCPNLRATTEKKTIILWAPFILAMINQGETDWMTLSCLECSLTPCARLLTTFRVITGTQARCKGPILSTSCMTSTRFTRFLKRLSDQCSGLIARRQKRKNEFDANIKSLEGMRLSQLCNKLRMMMTMTQLRGCHQARRMTT